MMNNSYSYNKLVLLWRPRFFRISQLLHGRNYSLLVNNNDKNNSVHDYGYANSSTYSNGNGWKNVINRPHRLLVLPTFKAHSQQHFCTTPIRTTADQTMISKLPDPIEQQCEQWAQIVRAEWEAENAKHIWMGKQLRCTNVLSNLETSKLFLSTKDLNPEQLRILRQLFRVGDAVELKLKDFPRSRQQSSNPSGLLGNITLSGTVRKQLPDAISITVNRHFNDLERQFLQQSSFDIKKALHPYQLENQLSFLAKRHSDWCKWPGYGTMLQAFKCQPLPDETGVDPVDWIGNRGKYLDPSQCTALSAALNMKRPIVAVHGPPGSGKTCILAEYLHILSRQGKRVLVLSKSNAGLYNLLGTFCKKFPSAASSKRTFLCLKRFDAPLASKLIADENIERLIEKKSFVKLTTNEQDAEMRKHYKLTETLKTAMADRQDYSGEEDLKREAEDMFKEMRETGHRQNEEATRDLLQSNSILFMTNSNALLNFFTRNGLTFDMVIIDDAANHSEFESWLMALPTVPILRLFGDYNQSEGTVHSSIGRELNFNKSLLQRLDEQFGPELNFHLRRQYRSNAAIQAWPNRAFYGQRAAEADESVRNIRLDDLLEEGKSPPQGIITDPLVLVDLSQLKGEWREWMFKVEKGGKSWLNWGEAFLAAFHLWHLFEHIPQLHPSKIAYLRRYDAQRNLIWRIFSALSEQHFNKLKQISMDRSANLQGQQFDIVLKDSVTIPPPALFTDPFHLKHLNNQMCRARRQFIWFANSQWLEQGSDQSRQLLQTFREYGRIVGPNQLLPLERGQFQKMSMLVEEIFRKVQEQRMRTNNNTTTFRRS